MYEQTLRLEAPNDRMLHLWFEPWAEGLAFPAGTVIELRAVSSIEGQMEIETTPERTAIFGWPGSTLRVMVEGVEVLSFPYPVPEFLSREKINLLFGDPPMPSMAEGGSSKPSWWRFWR